MMSIRTMSVSTLPLACLLLCLSAAQAHDRTAASVHTPDPARDRASILAMQGEYDVGFEFHETVAFAPGYTRVEPKRSGASEIVIVVEDTPDRIVLQHILVHAPTGHVTKHWRQDWTYEATHRFEFDADQTWGVHAIPADITRGAWTQCVYEVSDAPRYCGTGRWTYEGDAASWTSDSGWRPLPRREYTTREDYNALEVINRHAIVPGGWTHEQDNLKTVRAADGTIERRLVREFGFNDYRRYDGVDFTPALAYWTATSAYWARVRSRWETFLSQAPGMRLKTEVDGMAMIVPLFEQAQRVQDGGTVSDAEIDALFAQYVEPAAVGTPADRGAPRRP